MICVLSASWKEKKYFNTDVTFLCCMIEWVFLSLYFFKNCLLIPVEIAFGT